MEDRKKRHTAIVLAAGRGSRMKSDTPKQYLPLGGKPVLYYSLKAFEDSFVDETILVTGEGQEDYCRAEIVQKYGISKVKKILPGGQARYDSVYAGLLAATDADYVYIHDGARPFLTADILERARQTVEASGACAAGMPVKDTIKIADADGSVVDTPDRSHLWQIQTPQVFSYALIRDAYEKLMGRWPVETSKSSHYNEENVCAGITDDAMVVEKMSDCPIRLFEGSYRNIKITTPEDLAVAEALIRTSFE